jgi:hypothetical protein
MMRAPDILLLAGTVSAAIVTFALAIMLVSL